ncbi:hypothetical protein ES703_76411 [subsurface metagenome]
MSSNCHSITDIIKEIITQLGWTPGNSLVLFWDDHDKESGPGWDAHRISHSYASEPGRAPLLTIWYHVPETD